jgi:hypothetical protein
MAQPNQTITSIDWKSVFPFTRIFSAFRVAIQPSKLVLAMVAIMLLYTGGRLLDSMWEGVHPDEVKIYESQFFKSPGDPRTSLARLREDAQARAKSAYDSVQQRLWQKQLPPSTQPMPESFGESEMVKLIKEDRDAAVKRAQDTFKNADEKDLLDGAIREAYLRAEDEYRAVTGREGKGIFKTFLGYQAEQINSIANAVLQLRLVGRDSTFGSDGVIGRVFNFAVIGPGWALSQRPVYFVLLGLWGVFVWAIFGGAISRIAAVEVAREEKISIRNALRFSLAKMLSYATAPIMPIAIIAGFALSLALLGFLSEVPYVGPVVMGVVSVLFVVVIFLSVMLALALLGTVCGFGLMHPTISIEGSDSFDAISRSFSYVFARPWRLIFYSLVAIVHGALTYMFLRFMVWITLLLAHMFLLLWTSDQHTTTTSLASAFSAPQFYKLYTPPSSINLSGAEKFSSFFLSLWTYAFVTLLAAYLLSLYQSASTIIYFLLRREVDATQLDDVYIEPSDEEFDEDELDPPAAPAAPATQG